MMKGDIMTISEKVSYYKGLSEGSGIGGDSTGKIINGILEILGELTESVNEISDDQASIREEINDIVNDLLDIENSIDMTDEDEDYIDENDEYAGDKEVGECPAGCECGDDEILYSIECPSCGEIIYIDQEELDIGSMKCSACGETLEFDTEELDQNEDETEEPYGVEDEGNQENEDSLKGDKRWL